MSAFDYLIIILGILSVIPCTYLYFKEKGSAYKVLMLLSFIAGPLWALTVVLFRNANSVSMVLLFGKYIYINSVFLGTSFFLFSQYFPRKNLHSVIINLVVYGMAILLMLSIIFTNLFIESPILSGNNSIILGDAYKVWMIWMLGIFSFGLINILLNYKNLGKIERIQLKYFIFGIIIPIIGVVPTNAFLPLIGNFEYIWVGPLAMSAMSILLTIGITKKNSTNKYDLQIIIIKVLFMMVYIFEIFFLGYLFSQNHTNISNNLEKLVWLLILVVIALASYYLGNLLVKLVIEKLYKDKIPNYISIRDKYLDITADVLNADTLKQITIKQIMDSISLEWCGFVSLDRNENIKLFLSKNKKSFVFEESFDVLIGNIKKILDRLENVCNKDYLIYLLNNSYDRFSSKLLKRMKSVSIFLNSIDASEVMLLESGDNSKQIFLLGYKKNSAASINTKERELIKSLLKSLSLALSRANLHTQVEIANTSLKQKVSEQTKELQQKVKQLEEARRKEADMIDIMGHELRTPMSIVKLNTDLLHNLTENVIKKKEDFIKYVTRIRNAVETEIVLINTLLSSAKLEGDKIDLNPTKVDIVEQIKMAIHAQETRAKRKGIQLITQYDPKAQNVYADHARTVEIVSNLIDNAVKYTQKGYVKVTTQDEGDFIRVSVIDTGMGISQQDLERLGTKFFRTSNYIHSEYSDDIDIVRPGGSGLGLYVVFNLVKKMGGEIHVESQLGEGSNFTFALPKYRGQKPPDNSDNTKDMFERLGLKKEENIKDNLQQ